MKRLAKALVCLFVCLGTNAMAAAQHTAEEAPHFDLEMTGFEWSRFLDSQRKPFQVQPQGKLDPILALGKRNLDWLVFINSHRQNKLSLTSEATQIGYPIDQPKEYNETTVFQDYTSLIAQLPPSMRKVLVDREPFSADPGVSDDDYIAWGFKVDRVYQGAARWLTMQPYLAQLASRKQKDVRGYYYLTRDADRDQRLRDFDSLPKDLKEQYTDWLIQLCINGGSSENVCSSELSAAAQQRTVAQFYSRYLPGARSNWNSFFNIPSYARFGAIEWAAHRPDTAVVAFTDSGSSAQRNFLELNIEDEWKWLGWSLKILFSSSTPGSVNVYWQPGITPHVNGLGNGEIYMDSNAPLTEYDAQWTIRHEFGHVLGFPDCYLEFYDRSRKIITSYQFDITDLMCSRRGKLSSRHYQELKRVYYR